MRPDEAARKALLLQPDADAVRLELPAVDADALACRGHHHEQSRRVPAVKAGQLAALEQSESSVVRSSEHRAARTQQSASAVPEQQEPLALLRRQPVSRLAALRRRARTQHGDAALTRLRPERARASLPARERRLPFRDDDESQPAERQRARASRAPNGRECAQPDRRSADSDGCGRERPSDEGGLSPRLWELRTRLPDHVLEACSTLLLLTANRHQSRT